MPNDEMMQRVPFTSTVKGWLSKSNPKYDTFDELVPKRDDRLENQSVTYSDPNRKNSSASAVISRVMNDSSFSQYMYKSFDADKVRRMQDYRRMSMNSELSDAIDEICDECIVYNSEDNTVIKFDLRGEYNRDIKKEISKEWRRFVQFFDLEHKGWEYFRNFLTDGELYFENIISNNRPDYGILGVMSMPTELCSPIYENVQNENIKAFILKKRIMDVANNNTMKEIPVVLDKNQVTYMNSGKWNLDRSVRMPYIEAARRAYKQLTLIEDSIIIYRLVRAPERLVFKVDVGNLPVPQAEQYMKRIMNEYWNKRSFDPEKGIGNSYNPQSMLDAYWFPKRNGGQGSDVSVLQGGQNLGQLEDLMYFVKKLYKSLKVPTTRIEGSDTVKDGTEITREELKFAKFIERIQAQVAKGIKASFITHLKLRGLWDKHDLKELDLSLKFNTPTSFAIMREQQIFDVKYNNYSNLAAQEGISESFAQRYYLDWDDAKMSENREWMRKDAELFWEIEQIRTMGPDFYNQDSLMGDAEADIAGGAGGSGGGAGGMPPAFGPTPDDSVGSPPPPPDGGNPSDGGTPPPGTPPPIGQ